MNNYKKIIILLFLVTLFAVFGAKSINAKSNNQLQISGNPAVFYVDYERGLKKAYVNEVSFLSYGNKWNHVTRVDGGALDGLKEAKALKLKEESTVYYIDGNKKTAINSEQDFLDLGLKWGEILTVNRTDLDQYEDSSNKIANQTTVKAAFGKPESIHVRAKHSADNLFLPDGSKNNSVGILILSSDSVATVDTISIKLNGIFEKEIIGELRIENDKGEELDSAVMKTDRTATFHLGDKAIKLSPRRAQEIKLIIDLNKYDSCLNQNIEFDIINSTKIHGSLPVSGDFPLSVDDKRLVCGVTTLGSGLVEENELKNAVIESGRGGKKLASFTISENSGMEDVRIESITFKNAGTARGEDLLSFKIKDSTNRVVGRKSKMDDKTVVINLRKNTIKKGENKKFVLFGNISKNLAENINFQIDQVRMVGIDSGFNVNVSINNIDQIITVQKEKIFVEAKSNRKNSIVNKNVDGDVIGVFHIRNNFNEITEINSVNLALVASNTENIIENEIYLVNYKTGEIIGSHPGEDFIGQTVLFDINKELDKRKKNLTIALVADVIEGSTDGDWYQTELREISYEIYQRESTTDIVNVVGRKLKYQEPRRNNNTSNDDDDDTDNNDNDDSDDNDAQFIMPVNGYVSYGFHDPDYPLDFDHEGLDIVVPQGSAVVSVADGTVVSAVNGGSNGYSYVLISHGGGLYSHYGHLSEIGVNVGDVVRQGHMIALSGGRPGTPGAGNYSSGPHLHFEVWVNGFPVDPMEYLR